VATFADGKIEAFVGPIELGAADNLEAVIVDFIAGAKRSLDIAVQELDSEPIAQAILDARWRGVDVDLFLEQDYLRSDLKGSPPDLPESKPGETPEPENWSEIEAVLRVKPKDNRAWKPRQTVDDLGTPTTASLLPPARPRARYRQRRRIASNSSSPFAVASPCERSEDLNASWAYSECRLLSRNVVSPMSALTAVSSSPTSERTPSDG
jgi:hypothetical protein